MESPSESYLKQLTYSALKSYAKSRGVRVKGNIKAEKLISKILAAHDDSFTTLELKILNSCEKNKIQKFDEDKETISYTPRRETFDVDSRDDTACCGQSTSTVKSDKELCRKVSFLSPARQSPRLSSTPHSLSVKNRPKTPLPLKTSSTKRVTFHSPSTPGMKDNSAKSVKCRPSTPYACKLQKASTSGSRQAKVTTKMPRKNASGKKVAHQDTPLPLAKKTKLGNSKSPGMSAKGKATPIPHASAKCTGVTPGMSTKGKATPIPPASAKRLGVTPNFKKIHSKAFEKMESIDEYYKRKLERSTKKDVKVKSNPTLKEKSKKPVGEKKFVSKIPRYHPGVPFIPTVTSVRKARFDFSAVNNATNISTTARLTRQFRSKENNTTCKVLFPKDKPSEIMKRKKKFDLHASLSRKLPYKPYKGPLKPLSESKLNTLAQPLVDACPNKNNLIQKKQLKGPVQKSREDNRNILQGVRKNRRFELQMNRRLK